MSGIALRHMRVDREYQHALDEARDHAVCFGIVDETEDVVSHWSDAEGSVVPPIVVSGDLLGMLDSEEVKEAQKHLVWVGRAS